MTELLGLRFDDRDMDAVVAMLAARDPLAPLAYLVTPNADHLVRLARAPERYGPLYRDAAWRLLDSRVVARLGRAMGLPVPPVVPGSDLTARLFAEVVAPDDPIALLGGTPATASGLVARHGLRRFVQHIPPMGFDADPDAMEAALRFCEAARPRFLFLGVGSPRQEIVARALVARGVARGTALCIGASLMFLSGEERRAPRPVQRAGLEWAWRLAQDPRRLARRYLVEDPALVALLWQERARRRAA